MKNVPIPANLCQLIEAMPLEDAGALLVRAMTYANGKDEPSESVLAEGVFSLVKPAIDRAAKSAEKHRESGKSGGRPKKTKPQDQPTQEQAQTETRKRESKTKSVGKAVDSADVEPEIAAYTPNPALQQAIRSFVDFRKESGNPLTRHAFDLMLNKLTSLSSKDGDRVEILNNSIIGGWQGIFPLKRGKNDGKIYGPNGVEILPESEQLHDLDHLF